MKSLIAQILLALALVGLVLPPTAWATDCQYVGGTAKVCSNDHKILQSQQRNTTIVFPNATKVLTPDGTVTVNVTDIGVLDHTTAPKPSAVTADVGNVGLCSDSGHVHPAAPVVGGDMFLCGGQDEGVSNFLPYPYNGVMDETAAPTVGTPVVFDNIRQDVYATFDSPHWISPGEIKMWVWAKATSAATLHFAWGTCTGYYPTGEWDTPTVVLNVTSPTWQQLYATIAIPDGMLLKPNYSLCVGVSASTASGSPTVTLGASGDHYLRINGPW